MNVPAEGSRWWYEGRTRLRERFACGAPARLHRRLLTADRIAYRIANDQRRDHLDLALPAC